MGTLAGGNGADRIQGSGQAVVDVLIPALNEEASVGHVLSALPKGNAIGVRRVVVADNGSTDRTAERARNHGALVVHEPRRGYGHACLAAMAAISDDPPDIVVFLDADFSDHPEELPLLTAPIEQDKADFVIGSRTRGTSEPGALLPQARFGNWLACTLMHLIWGVRYTDLGPFRAIRYDALIRMDMTDKTYGWTIEMQIKAALLGLRHAEVPVSYRKRIGQSKVTGTIRGTIGAGVWILGTIGAYALRLRGTR
ncbi:MAG: UDP-glucose--dolichyl-phosphate glucosyltransferase [Bacteroidetes bacterium CG12_big_fil_rev_8_21_14_0_65_60_17]|nr:MAG: UDP-glucose--dolichyl-phosphate glucosyltransferase [Bacteroidetes bacterium CG12_big_fil_rev_8_21_14_0_65_60_17]